MVRWVLLRKFQHELKERPLRTQMIFASVVALAGDTVAQNAVEGKRLFSDQDHVRTFRMACFSTFVWTPLGYKWFLFASRVWPKATLANVAKKTSIDQLVIIPITLSLFLCTNEALQGSSVAKIKRRIESDYQTILVKNWQVWAPVQFFNFYLIPVAYQVIFVRVIGFFWTIFMSFISHKEI